MSKNTSKADQERDERVKKKADSFFGAFLMTENGKPKSSLAIYSLFLSFAWIAVYAFCYWAAVEYLTDPLDGLSAFASNLVIALTASIVGTAVCCVPHFFFKDKRLVFCGFLWLVLYALVVLIAMLILLQGTGVGAFLNFFGWFVAIPVVLGCLASGLLFRRDWRPQKPKEEEPEWKKYINTRR